jgi:hypothetical protein
MPNFLQRFQAKVSGRTLRARPGKKRSVLDYLPTRALDELKTSKTAVLRPSYAAVSSVRHHRSGNRGRPLAFSKTGPVLARSFARKSIRHRVIRRSSGF